STASAYYTLMDTRSFSNRLLSKRRDSDEQRLRLAAEVTPHPAPSADGLVKTPSPDTPSPHGRGLHFRLGSEGLRCVLPSDYCLLPTVLPQSTAPSPRSGSKEQVWSIQNPKSKIQNCPSTQPPFWQ